MTSDLIVRIETATSPAVDIEYASHSGALTITCTGCTWDDRIPTGATVTDPPEREDVLIDRHLPAARRSAQGHAATH
ncbi:hypothetical protein ACIPW9_36255 [Streptomyces sp. NPDC090052]|uniref:hypothetical protein n=1 Tax=Streptomyces sp. NPDC090052 TaxID=3365931 RepID=UPI0037F72376